MSLSIQTIQSELTPGHFVVIWLREGEAFYWRDYDRYPLAADTVYCLHPGRGMIFDFSESAQGIALSFNAEFLSPLKEDLQMVMQSGLFDIFKLTALPLDKESGQEIERMVCHLAKEYYQDREWRTEILRIYLKLLLIQLCRMHKSALQPSMLGHPRDVRLTNNFIHMVHQHYATRKKVSDYAVELGVAANSLNTKVKKISGFTASHHIQQRIVLEAKRQARWEGKTLKQISYHLGFDDTAHFSKFFKRVAGMSFSNFKKSGFNS